MSSATAKTVHVRLNGESEPREAAVVAADPSRDLALLRVDATGLSRGNVRARPTTSASATRCWPSATRSISMATQPSPSASSRRCDRTLNTESGSLKGLIQTDAAVSSGNSGGPLIDALGRVVGITTLASSTGFGSTANGLGFAISTAELLPDDGAAASPGERCMRHKSGYLGVQLERRTDGGSGALVAEVVDGSGADKAGIEVGDVVVAVDGQAISGQAGLIATIRDLAPGDTAAVSLTRDGKPVDVDVVLGTAPAELLSRSGAAAESVRRRAVRRA